MKDYIKIADRISKMVKCTITQRGTPTQNNPVNIEIEIKEPYVIGYSMYICYDFGRWSIDYSRYPCDDIRVNMNHIKNIKTDKEMFDCVRQIVAELRKKERAPHIQDKGELEHGMDRI